MPLLYPIDKLNKMQQRAVIWILKTFCILPLFGIKFITGLIPIHYHLQKLSDRNQLHIATLPSNNRLKKLLEKIFALLSLQHCFLLENITSKQ